MRHVSEEDNFLFKLIISYNQRANDEGLKLETSALKLYTEVTLRYQLSC